MSHLPPTAHTLLYLVRKFSALPDSHDEWTHFALTKNFLGLECNVHFSSVRIIFRLNSILFIPAISNDSKK
jgi:hypothetical protein